LVRAGEDGGRHGRLRALGKAITTIRRTGLHPRVLAIMQAREKMVSGDLALDWGCAENLAYASLIQEGYPVRLTGQDSGRGTFFHRHAVLHDQVTGRRYVPLQHLATNQPTFTVTDSVLSEEAVMGFEYGFSTTEPHCLTIWEGQFGDFCNGAQVIIDQFISSGEAKWGRLSGLTLFLPHGYEGQGPEHSSARLERFCSSVRRVQHAGVRALDAGADVPHAAPADAADLRKPLIIMTPKSLLRHPLSVSRLEELASGGFRTGHRRDRRHQAAGGHAHRACAAARCISICLKARREAKVETVAIVRLEQLYPFPSDEYEAIIAQVFERPRNRLVPGRAAESGQLVSDPPSPAVAARARSTSCCMPGRAGAAAPATGISGAARAAAEESRHRRAAGRAAGRDLRQTMRLPAAQTRTGS
jgi:2-oxoglutarate dehydrogenase E1 component